MNVSQASVETELKLLVPPRSIGRLGAHPLLRGRGHAARQRLYSVYFDTPKLDLWRQGVALRLRREGKRWVQTVKGSGTVHGGLHRRIEAESEVAGPVPDFSRIRDRELAATFASRRLRAQLKPVFTADFIRHSTILDLDADTRVEASVDHGVIRSGRRAEGVSELELELKKGAP